MDDLDRQICELTHQLDEVQLRAVLTTAAAMTAGLEGLDGRPEQDEGLESGLPER